MIPGLTSEAEARLVAVLDSRVTDVTAALFADRAFTLLQASEDEARRLGFEATGPVGATVVVTDPERPVGRVRVQADGRDGLLFFDNAEGGSFDATIRILGDDAVVFCNAGGAGQVVLRTVFMRSHNQFLYWGRMSTAVDLSIEIEGSGEGVVIGDDALIAGEVWIRNHDMHSLQDLATGERISRSPVTTVLERHVWLGHRALLLNCDRVGAGTAVGAGAIVKGTLPGCVVAAGVPARVIRERVSWGRDVAGMTNAERRSLGLRDVPDCQTIADPASYIDR